jgi:hypothetical protein
MQVMTVIVLSLDPVWSDFLTGNGRALAMRLRRAGSEIGLAIGTISY